jgi:hypothetical protein
VTLLGAVTGGAISSRSQRRHWIRDKQVEACAAIVSESTRTQIALRRLWRHSEEVDWNGWNQALSLISLVGTPAAVEAAATMDAAFWRSTDRMKDAGAFDESLWADIVRDLETTRLAFINGVRGDTVGLGARLEHLPVVRPPLPGQQPATSENESSAS